MMKRLVFIPIIGALAIGGLLLSCTRHHDDSTSGGADIVERFETALEPPWQWIRRNDRSIKIDETGLHLQLAEGSLMGGGTGVENILIRPLANDTKTVTLTFEFEPTLQYEQAGLILYTDDDTYIKLVKEFVDGTPWIVMVVEVATKITSLQKVPAFSGPATVGFEIKEQAIRSFCHDENGILVEIGSAEFPMHPRPSIGLFTQNGTPSDPRWANFREMAISSKPVEVHKVHEVH